MSKVFKITGDCIPEINYMVDISSRLDQITNMVDKGQYFVINRARQYGKTTTLGLLKRHLIKKYHVWSLSFEGLSTESFASEDIFVRDFLEDILLPEIRRGDSTVAELIENFVARPERTRITKLGTLLNKICTIYDGKVVMIIDEVDQACNNEVFIDFLAVLRKMYLGRSSGKASFQSVILASVYDIKNMKIKIRPEGEHRLNSPWNIAEPFLVDMSFSTTDISKMLHDYESDQDFRINVEWFSRQIYAYTSGYPYLVSYICKLLDEVVCYVPEFGCKKAAWTEDGFQRAIKIILTTGSTLFDDMIKKMNDYPKLKSLTEDILLQGLEVPNNPDNQILQLGFTFGFFTEKDGKAVIANRIFETRIYNWLISEVTENSHMFKLGDAEKKLFVNNGSLDMDLILKRFKLHYDSLYCDREQSFLEHEGRFLFLTFLKPIINGVGNYYIEAQTRDQKRTDIIVDYHGRQYIIETKIWHGEEYQAKGRKQLCDYLDIYHQTMGWLVSFCFNRGKNLKTEFRTVKENGKVIKEVII